VLEFSRGLWCVVVVESWMGGEVVRGRERERGGVWCLVVVAGFGRRLRGCWTEAGAKDFAVRERGGRVRKPAGKRNLEQTSSPDDLPATVGSWQHSAS
jgi:hypothetical protein